MLSSAFWNQTVQSLYSCDPDSKSESTINIYCENNVILLEKMVFSYVYKHIGPRWLLQTLVAHRLYYLILSRHIDVFYSIFFKLIVLHAFLPFQNHTGASNLLRSILKAFSVCLGILSQKTGIITSDTSKSDLCAPFVKSGSEKKCMSYSHCHLILSASK